MEQEEHNSSRKRKSEDEDIVNEAESQTPSKRSKGEDTPGTSSYPIRSHRVIIGTEVEKRIEYIFANASQRNAEKYEREFLFAMFRWLLNRPFRIEMEKWQFYRIKVLALDPSFVNFDERMRIYCFKLKILFMNIEKDYSVKPVDNVQANPGIIPDDVFIKRGVNEVWTDIPNTKDFIVGEFSCLASYTNGSFDRILNFDITKEDRKKLVYITEISEYWEKILKTVQMNAPEKKEKASMREVMQHQLDITTIFHGRVKVFSIDNRPYLWSSGMPDRLFHLAYNASKMFLRGIPLNAMFGDAGQSIILDFKLIEASRTVDQILMCDPYVTNRIGGVNVRTSIVVEGNPRILHTEMLLLRPDPPTLFLERKLLHATKIGDGSWIGIGYCYFNINWDTIERSSYEEYAPIDMAFIDSYYISLFMKKFRSIILSDESIHRRAIFNYDRGSNNTSSGMLRFHLPFFFTIEKKDNSISSPHMYNVSPLFLPIDFRSDEYLFIDVVPSGITTRTMDSTEELTVTFSSGGYRSFEINFAKSDIIKFCRYDLQNSNFASLPVKIIDFKDGSIIFNYIIRSPRVYINTFVHKRLKNVIISIGRDYKVTLLDRNTLQPSTEVALTLEQLANLCFE